MVKALLTSLWLYNAKDYYQRDLSDKYTGTLFNYEEGIVINIYDKLLEKKVENSDTDIVRIETRFESVRKIKEFFGDNNLSNITLSTIRDNLDKIYRDLCGDVFTSMANESIIYRLLFYNDTKSCDSLKKRLTLERDALTDRRLLLEAIKYIATLEGWNQDKIKYNREVVNELFPKGSSFDKASLIETIFNSLLKNNISFKTELDNALMDDCLWHLILNDSLNKLGKVGVLPEDATLLENGEELSLWRCSLLTSK